MKILATFIRYTNLQVKQVSLTIIQIQSPLMTRMTTTLSRFQEQEL